MCCKHRSVCIGVVQLVVFGFAGRWGTSKPFQNRWIKGLRCSFQLPQSLTAHRKKFLFCAAGMVPHKTPRGADALERLQCYEGVPPPFDKQKRMVLPDALQVLRLQHGHRFCKVGDLSASVGWKHKDTVAELEAKRKAKSHAFFVAKKKALAIRAKAAAKVAA